MLYLYFNMTQLVGQIIMFKLYEHNLLLNTMQAISKANQTCFGGGLQQIDTATCDDPIKFVECDYDSTPGGLLKSNFSLTSSSDWAVEGFFCNSYENKSLGTCAVNQFNCFHDEPISTTNAVLLGLGISAVVIAFAAFFYLRDPKRRDNVKNFFAATYERTAGFFNECWRSTAEKLPLVRPIHTI